MTTTETAPAHALNDPAPPTTTIGTQMPVDATAALPSPGDEDDLVLGGRLADFALSKLAYWVNGESGEVSSYLLELACRIGELYVHAADVQLRTDQHAASQHAAAEAAAIAAAQQQLETTGEHLAGNVETATGQQADGPLQFHEDMAEAVIEQAEATG